MSAPPIAISSLVFSVTEPTALGDGSDVRYKVAILDPARLEVSVHHVFRTYKECKPVFKKLESMNDDKPLPKVPKTKVFGATDPDFIEYRRCAIEGFLNAVVDNQFLSKDVDFLELVGYRDYLATRKAAKHSKRNNNLESQGTGIFSILTSVTSAYIDEEALIAAARCWLRSSEYGMVRVLPALGHPLFPARKLYMLIENGAHTQFLLSASNILRPNVPLSGENDEKFKRITHFLQNLDPSLFCTTEKIALDPVGKVVFVVRPVMRNGSLLDLLHHSDPLEAGERKYAEGKISEVNIDQLCVMCSKILRIMMACHEFNIPISHVSLGNLMLSSGHGLVLSDMEELFFGNSRLPMCFPHRDGAEDTTKTSVDVRLFGVLLLELALGRILDPQKVAALLLCQGEPYEPYITEPDEGEEGEADAETRRHILPNLDIVPDAVRNLLHFVFHPTIPADLRVLVHHSFFAPVLQQKKESSGSSSPRGAAATGEDDANPSKSIMKVKKKDIEVVYEACELWGNEMRRRGEEKKRQAEERVKIRELKRNKASRRRDDNEDDGPMSPTSPLQSSLPQAGAAPAAPPPPLQQNAPAAPAAPVPSVQPNAPAANAAPPATSGAQPAATAPTTSTIPPPPATKTPPPPPPAKGIPPPPPAKGIPPPPTAKGMPPPPPPSVAAELPQPQQGRSALLDEIRKGTNLTYRGE